MEVCRFCLSELRKQKDRVKIDEAVKKVYYEFMNEELFESSSLPQSCCKSCLFSINQSIELKENITKNQVQLLNLIPHIKNEVPEEIENYESFRNFIKVEADEFEEITIEKETVKEEVEFYPLCFKTDATPKSEIDQKPRSKRTTRKSYSTIVEKRRKHAQSNEKRKKRLICDMCGMKKITKEKLLKHLQQKHLNKLQKAYCDLCQKPFASVENFKHHYQYFHDMKFQKICEFCGLSFLSKYSHAKHIRVHHTKERPFSCEKCDKTFACSYILRTHLLNVHSDNPIDCDVCGKMFQSEMYVKLHKKSVHGQKVFYCDHPDCKMSFARPASLKLHKISHGESKNHHCRICENSYKHRKSLEKHILTTHYKMEYKCFMQGCNASYFRKDFLKSHVKNKHPQLTEAELELIYEKIRSMPIPSLKEYFKLPPRKF